MYTAEPYVYSRMTYEYSISRTSNNNNQTETIPLNNNKENKTEK